MEGGLWYRLVEERGWSEERFAQLLSTMWVAALARRGPVNDPARRRSEAPEQ
jgi:hypothetical protein